jgi:hypothetical protein
VARRTGASTAICLYGGEATDFASWNAGGSATELSATDARAQGGCRC